MLVLLNEWVFVSIVVRAFIYVILIYLSVERVFLSIVVRVFIYIRFGFYIRFALLIVVRKSVIVVSGRMGEIAVFKVIIIVVKTE